MSELTHPNPNAHAEFLPIPLVFFSYSRAQLRLVQTIAREVRLVGLGTWVDLENLVPGETWQRAIETALGQAQIFVACICRRSVESAWTSVELDAAVRSGIPILPVLLEEIAIEALPPSLARRQAVNAYNIAPNARPGHVTKAIARALGVVVPDASFFADGTTSPYVIVLGGKVLDFDLGTIRPRRIVHIEHIGLHRLGDLLADIGHGETVVLMVKTEGHTLEAAALLGVLSGVTKALTLIEPTTQSTGLDSIAALLGIKYSRVRNQMEMRT